MLKNTTVIISPKSYSSVSFGVGSSKKLLVEGVI